MELTIIIVGIVQLIIGLICGYYTGYRVGHRAGAQEILDLQLEIVLGNAGIKYE